jgi:hypothetical protein
MLDKKTIIALITKRNLKTVAAESGASYNAIGYMLREGGGRTDVLEKLSVYLVNEIQAEAALVAHEAAKIGYNIGE